MTQMFIRWPRLASGLFFWLLLLLSGWARPAQATHLVGGEMELVHVSGESYRLVLNLYFDAVNGDAGALDSDLTAGIFDKSTDRSMRNIVLPLTSNTDIAYTNPACAQAALRTRKLVYSQTLLLPASTYNSFQGYYVAVERCCRNRDIANILNPAGAAQTFYLEFPPVIRNGQPFYDSTPRIFPPLTDYACLNSLFYYDFGGTDADGDSLVYDLVTPLNGHATTLPSNTKPDPRPAPYIPINWLPGLSAQNQIPGAPPLRVNRATGRLTVQPTDLGLFVFGVRCSEYRRGIKIGETRRDFQLMVLDCPANSKPKILMLPDPGTRTAYQPGRDTLRLVPGGNRCVRLRFTDPDRQSNLTLALRPVNFMGLLPTFTTATSGSVHMPGAPDTLTATLCFSECIDTQNHVYLLDVIVADDGCSLPKRDTVRVAFTAYRPPNSAPTLSSTVGPTLPLHVRVGDLVTFDLTGTDPDNDPVTLEMTGQGFTPTTVGASLAQSMVGTAQQGRFSWRVPCSTLRTEPYVFQFMAAAAPCGTRQTAPLLTVPIIIDYSNVAPVLTTDLPPTGANGETPVVRLPLGGVFTATFTGTDADRDGLTLTATGQDFDINAAGMRFNAQNGTGQASATFRWDVSCDAVRQQKDLLVTFQLVDATCRPVPQTRTVRFEVQQPEPVEFFAPNIITPNNDPEKLNEDFAIAKLPPDFCDSRFADVKIFSRWGRLVYESTDRNFRWHGGGVAGIYYYLVSYTDGRRFKSWLEVAL